jgi:hypothetical protein
MLKRTLGWLEPRLKAYPPTRRAVEVYRANALCRRPGRGCSARFEARLLAVVKEVGLDRLPFGFVICRVCGKRCCLEHEPFIDPGLTCAYTRSRLAGWLASLDAFAAGRPARPRRVLLFSVMPHWVDYCLPLALALAGRDCLVDYAWLPWLHMDRDEPWDLLSKTTHAHWSVPPWVRIHPRVRLVNLLHVAPGPVGEERRRLAVRIARLDTQYLLRRELLDEQDEGTRELLAFRQRRQLDCIARLGAWLARNRYDSALVPNGAIYEFATAYQVLRQNRLRVVTFDFGERKGVIFPSDTEPAVQVDTRALWADDEPHALSAEREKRVMSFLLRREMPNWQDSNYLWVGQASSPKEAGALCDELKLDPSRPVALMCTNIAHDSAVLGMTRAFGSMAKWIIETVGWFLHRPDWQLVVRCHPVEATHPSNEPVAEMIAQRYPQLPAHVRVIRPADRVNTYGLIRLSRFGLVFSTTVGLEMAVRGVPVVVSGRVHYQGKGFTIDPASPAEYFARLGQLTATPPPRLTQREVELARCYADVYFFGYARPIMWYEPGQTDLDMKRCSLEQLLRGDCPPDFLETLDFFAGRHLDPKPASTGEAA